MREAVPPATCWMAPPEGAVTTTLPPAPLGPPPAPTLTPPAPYTYIWEAGPLEVRNTLPAVVDRVASPPAAPVDRRERAAGVERMAPAEAVAERMPLSAASCRSVPPLITALHPPHTLSSPGEVSRALCAPASVTPCPPLTPTTPTEARLTRVGESRVMAPEPVTRARLPVEALPVRVP